jgi:tetratricopeptide (TPR) repeat protein
MDVLIAFLTIVMIYIYGIVYYFHKKSKKRQKKKSDLMIRAITHFRRKNFDQSKYYFELAYNESVETEDMYVAAESLYYLAFIYDAHGDNPKALEILQEALDYYQHLNDIEGIQKSQDLMAKISQ